MTYSLGVDLGTTTSAAALRRGIGLEVCALGDLAATMPSAALERADGSILVGEEAAERSPYDTTLVARHVMARLADQDPIVLDGRPQDPVRLTHALLETVIDRVRRLYGDRPHELVLTYPLFPPGGSAALLDRVAEASAVERALLLPHPVAAAAKLAQDVDISVGTTVAVLDFGGGSFEATVVRRTSDGFDVVGPPGGLADLGGVEIDDAVFARVDAALGHVLQTVAPDDAEGMAAVRRLRTACRAAKEQLSYSAETTVEVALPHLSTWVPITRAQLEDDIRPWLIAAVDVVARTITAAGLSLPDVHVALLVGGSSRIPLFGELVAARLGLPIVTDPFPELTVALGAALFGQDNPAPRPPSGPIEGDDVGAGDDLRALAAWFADPGANPPAGAGVVPEATMPWGDLVGDPPARADPVADDQWADDAWDGWDEPLEDAEADLSATVSERPFAGPTTGETDLWGAPSRRGRRRAAQGGDGDDDASMDPPTDSDQGDGEGTSPRLVLALIGAALAVVGIAGAALAAGMGGSDDPGLTLVDPTRSAITTSTTTSTSTTTATAPTTTAEPPSTTTEPEDEYEWEQPPPPPTEPPTTTTTAPPTTTAVPPTTTSTTTRSTTTMTNCPGPPTTPPPSTTSTTDCPRPRD